MSDTIFALASASGIGGVAVIRASGEGALDGAKALTGRKKFAPRYAYLETLKKKTPVSRETGTILDHAIVIFFESPSSYTGEDVVEYHIHGGAAVINGVIDALADLPDHRPAEAGEFTKRAFQNGKMDLTAAEGLMDLIAAQTQMQAAQALAQMEGSLAKLYEFWRDSALRALAHAEADLEFPDEDLPDEMPDIVLSTAQTLLLSIEEHLSDDRGQRLRHGIHIAILGEPNAGKSSLVNAIAGRDVAITSDIAGTTRDVITVSMNLDGYPITLYDTAGIRNAPSDAIEAEGVRRAIKAGHEADIKLLLLDGCCKENQDILAQHQDKNAIIVYSKSDCRGFSNAGNNLKVSAKTGAGLEDLLSALSQKTKEIAGIKEAPALTRTRHRKALEGAASHLRRACKATQADLAAEDLRLCARSLGRITGRVDVEDVLDTIFRDFCIGK